MKKIYVGASIGVIFLVLACITYIFYTNENIVKKDTLGEFTETQLNAYTDWRESYLKPYNKGLLVNTSDTPNSLKTVSEAHGYGMFITVIASKNNVSTAEKDFNLLYNYYLDNLDKGTNLMSWKQEQDYLDPNVLNKFDNNATDGDLYIAYSLIEASKLWSEHSDIYLKQAKAILTDILDYNYIKTNNFGIITIGSWVTEGSSLENVFRSSDVIPLFLKEFHVVTGDDTWLDIEKNMMKYLNDVSKENASGLISDFVYVENNTGVSAKQIVIEQKTDTEYSWNAARIPLQLGYTFEQEESKEILKPMLTFFKSQEHVYAGYNLNGTPTVDYDSMVFGGVLESIVKKESTWIGIPTNYEYFMEQEIIGSNYYGDTLFLISNIY